MIIVSIEKPACSGKAPSPEYAGAGLCSKGCQCRTPTRLDHTKFADIYGIRGLTCQGLAVSDNNILINNNVTHIAVVAYSGVLHDNAVGNLCSLADVHTLKENTVINLTLNNTAVAYERVGNL